MWLLIWIVQTGQAVTLFHTFTYEADKCLSLKGEPEINSNNPSTMPHWPYICLDILPHSLFINRDV